MDPLSKVRLLMKAVKARAEENNLELKNFVLAPSEDGESDFVQLAMIITPEALETIEETQTRQTDDQFADMMSGVSLDGFAEESPGLPDEVQSRVDETAEEIFGAYDDESNASEDDD